MFVLGLLLGPVVALVAAQFLVHSAVVRGVYAPALAVAAVIVVLLLPMGSIELRSGLALGLVAGSILSASPMSTAPEEDALQ